MIELIKKIDLKTGIIIILLVVMCAISVTWVVSSSQDKDTISLLKDDNKKLEKEKELIEINIASIKSGIIKDSLANEKLKEENIIITNRVNKLEKENQKNELLQKKKNDELLIKKKLLEEQLKKPLKEGDDLLQSLQNKFNK